MKFRPVTQSILLILIAFSILGCQSTSQTRKAVVVSLELSELKPDEAVMHVIHDKKSPNKLRSIAKPASKGVLDCESGKMTVSWLKDNSAPKHEDFPDGQNSVSVILKCV